MWMKNEYLQVKELKKDLLVDGLIEKYDDNSPYILAEILECDEKTYNELSEYGDVDDLVVLFRRPNKLPFKDTLIVSNRDIISVMTRDEYNSL